MTEPAQKCKKNAIFQAKLFLKTVYFFLCYNIYVKPIP